MESRINELKKLGLTEAEIKILVKKIPQGVSGRSDLKTSVTIGDYKGKATLSMIKGTSSFINKPFTFGKEKAKMIVEQFDAIKKFSEQ